MTTATKPTHQTPIERGASCIPILIGILVGCFAPLFALVYGVRQRSWSVGLIAFIPVLMWGFSEPDIEGGLRQRRKYAFQLAGGALTCGAALVLKKETKEQLAAKLND